MPERKTGPVKPPILDMEARKAGQDGQAAKTEPAGGEAKAKSAASASAKPGSGRSGATRGPMGSALALAAGGGVIGGAVLGLALSYGAASLGLWPANAGATAGDVAALDQRVAKLEQETGAAISGLSAFNDRVGKLETKGTQASDALSAQVSDLATRLDNLPQPDLSAIRSEIKSLSDRIDAIAAGASSGDASALSAKLSSVEADIVDLRARITQVEGRASAAATDAASAKAQLAALAQQPAGPDTSALPLALSAYEAALRDGRPFAAELSALSASLPQLQIPDPVRSAAASGLTRPDRVASELDAAVPAMLAAQPVTSGASWSEMALERLKGLLAMRPAGETEGQAPDAVVSRIEAAVARQDFAAADSLMQSLPQPMIAAAGPVPGELATLASAYSVLDAARTQALSQVAGANR